MCFDALKKFYEFNKIKGASLKKEIIAGITTFIAISYLFLLIPKVINSKESSELDSFSHPLLDGPHYTRPSEYNNMKTPEVLLSGNHKEIEKWFTSKREEKTKLKRPDLWEKHKELKKGNI